MADCHVTLIAGESNGAPMFEPVHVAPLGGNLYRVIFSPGLVYGVAAGDEIELEADGRFKIVRRGRNLAVRVLSEFPLSEYADQLAGVVSARLAGRLDGQITHGLAFTIPVSTGFSTVEEVFDGFVQEHPGTVWEYGNVYDDAGKPIGWWQSAV